MMSINPLQPSSLSQLALPESTSKDKSELVQEDFLTLMMAQLQYQDPLEPQTNGEFLGQMAQFSTADGIKELQNSINALGSSLYSNQALQATSLVGRDVQVSSNTAKLTDNGLSGKIILSAPASDVEVQIRDSVGNLVKTISLGTHNEGAVDFTWSGIADNGKPMTQEHYQITAQGILNGQTTQLQTALQAKVNSVTVADDGDALLLDLDGLGVVDFKHISTVF